MKKRSLKNLALNKESISNFHNTIFGGAKPYTTSIATGDPLPMTADVRDCPDNTLLSGCKSLNVPCETLYCQRG